MPVSTTSDDFATLHQSRAPPDLAKSCNNRLGRVAAPGVVFQIIPRLGNAPRQSSRKCAAQDQVLVDLVHGCKRGGFRRKAAI